MPEDKAKKSNILLIAGFTPFFLEKPISWWKEIEPEIIKKRTLGALSPTWSKNMILIEKEQKIKQSEFLRQISDLGYEKIFSAKDGIAAGEEKIYPGTFKILGSTVLIFPINRQVPIFIEFLGNYIESVEEHQFVEKEIRRWSPKDAHFDLSDGDYAVHIDHGIGIFRGTVEKNKEQYFKIEYARPRKNAEPDILFVPASEKKRLEPYFGLEKPRLSRLGTQFWKKTKKKSREEIIAFAEELIKIYRNRAGQKRPPHLPDTLEKNIWDSFEYELTQSQERAMDEIFKDMSSADPMERLLTGDVGFGKTELALRASLRAVLNGKQAVILTPTTVLADQHLNVFSKRLNPPSGGLPIKISALTRLEPKNKNKKTLQDLKSGNVDIVIGSHRLFSKDVNIKNLGLVIIDEEQRFGVKHKEHFKRSHPTADILSLTATPIPRTLAFFFSGIRSASEIKEAPRGRRAPLTRVLPFSKTLIKSAIKSELSRKGQVYYVSDRIHTIPKTLEMLKILAPRSKIGSMHGRMAERDIIYTMKRFRKKEIDILVSTTIIENGLDISSVNTLIVENAALLGMSQAHQLRGRIGRGDKQAVAYFLYNPKKLAPKAEKRLGNLMDFQELGAGLEIAKRDFEIRGSGNILGKEQSGIANKIGWNLYFQFVNEAVENLRIGRET